LQPDHHPSGAGIEIARATRSKKTLREARKEPRHKATACSTVLRPMSPTAMDGSAA
jgi:hypothetical protein